MEHQQTSKTYVTERRNMTKVVKLYDLSFAPNPKRLRLYCIERDILKEFDLEDVTVPVFSQLKHSFLVVSFIFV